MADSQASLLDQVRSGANRQLQVLAAGGLLPLAPEDLIPLQVGYTRGGDSELASKAADSLRQVDVRITASFLERQAAEDVLAFFAAEATHPRILEAILRRRDVPRRLLVDLARRLPTDLQEVLVLRQDAILEEPGILAALEENPEISAYTQRRIAEYRDHLLPRERRAEAVAAPPATAGIPGSLPEIDDAALRSEVEAALALPAQGEIDEDTGLTEGQIRMLSIPARLKLARRAPRSLRSILLRDNNAQVALAALLSNPLSDQEIEQTAASRSVPEEVLGAICKRREWVQRYPVAKALVLNPRAPLAMALKLVNRLSVRDLRELGRDRNVADALRSTALRLYRIKQQ